ncbi:MAG: mannosyltransferase [Candidatus Parcubacteria bacterium]|nr:MAG: mannosyltransferase [Candidatus Parcubacteria bacterium]
MKILQVNKLYYPWIGGVETIVQQIAEGLNKKDNLEIDVLVCNNRSERKIEEINGVKVFRASSFGIYLGMPLSIDFFLLYKKIFKNYDLIFLHYPFPLGFVAYFLFSRNKYLVIWYHSDIVRQKFLEIIFKPFHLFAFKKTRKIFVSNPNLIESSDYLKKFKEKCVVIPFGIDLEKFKLTDEIKKEAEKIQREIGSPIVLSVGRLTYYKGFEYLIESAKNVEAKFLIIGEGKLKDKLLNLIKKYNLENKVFIAPPVKNLSPYYYACDIFVLPSIQKSEAFGIVLLEAMACGKPVISTEIGTGTSWVNQDNITGFVVEPKNSKSLAAAINKLLNDKELYSKFSQNALNRAKNLSLENFLNKLKTELNNLPEILRI